MKALLLVVIAGLTMAGCASGALKAEAPLPTPAQLAALLAAPAPVRASRIAKAPATFTLSAPHFIMQGHAFRVSCYVPESLGAGVIRFGLEGVQVSGPKEIRTIENSLLIERLECGEWRAVCLVHTASGDRFAEQAVQVRGGLCGDDGGA